MIDVELEEIDGKSRAEVCSLHVREDQGSFVDSNIESLEEREKAVAAGLAVPAFAILADGKAVGFMMLSFGPDGELSPDDDVWYLWRFMIDWRHQGRGIGRKALEKAISYMRGMPFGRTERCLVSYERENYAASGLYASLGFHETGEIVEGEVVAELLF